VSEHTGNTPEQAQVTGIQLADIKKRQTNKFKRSWQK
jgi:hypothetical protein